MVDARRAGRRALGTGRALRGGGRCGLLAAAAGETLAEGLHKGVILAAGVQRLRHAVDVERGHIGIAERGHAVVTGDFGGLVRFGADGQVLAAEGDVLGEGGQIDIGGHGTGVLLGELEGLVEQGHVDSFDLGEAAAVLRGEGVAAVGHLGLRGGEIGEDRIALGIGEGGGDEVLVHGAAWVAGRRPWFIKPQTAVEPESSVEPSHVGLGEREVECPLVEADCTKNAAGTQEYNFHDGAAAAFGKKGARDVLGGLPFEKISQMDGEFSEMMEQKGRAEDLFARSEVKRARRSGLFSLPAGQKGHREHLFSETAVQRGGMAAFQFGAEGRRGCAPGSFTDKIGTEKRIYMPMPPRYKPCINLSPPIE